VHVARGLSRRLVLLAALVAALRHTSETLGATGEALTAGNPDRAGATIIGRRPGAAHLLAQVGTWKTALPAAARRAGMPLPRRLR
jgi:hypothetical protein